MKPVLFFLVLVLFQINDSDAVMKLGDTPKRVILHGEKGGQLDGKAWDSYKLFGNITIIFYVDPDKRNLNRQIFAELKRQRSKSSSVVSVAVINMAATWIPNRLIESGLSREQKEYPHTIFVKDKAGVLVKEWGLDDDNSDILILNRFGEVIYSKNGRLNDDDLNDMLTVIANSIRQEHQIGGVKQ